MKQNQFHISLLKFDLLLLNLQRKIGSWEITESKKKRKRNRSPVCNNLANINQSYRYS